jgi:hypothetical protein
MNRDEKRRERREKRVIKKKGNRHRRMYLKDQLQRNPDEQTVEDDFEYGPSESSENSLGAGAPSKKKKRKARVDDLDQFIRERSEKNPKFRELLDEAETRKMQEHFQANRVLDPEKANETFRKIDNLLDNLDKIQENEKS